MYMNHLSYNILAVALVLSCVLLLSACAKPANTSYHIHPTSIDGQKDLEPSQVITGNASWYGPYFHGRKTANGEIYNMYAMTAAHKDLPLGSLIRVTNLKNQKQLFLRVNDRGPYIHGRVLDLSYAAAKELDIVQHGVSTVKIEVYPFKKEHVKIASRQKQPVLP